MKTSQDRQQQVRRDRVEAMIDGCIAALFRRLPMLCGFALEADLQPAEVSVHSWPGCVAGEDLYNEIVNALVDLVDERPRRRGVAARQDVRARAAVIEVRHPS